MAGLWLVALAFLLPSAAAPLSAGGLTSADPATAEIVRAIGTVDQILSTDADRDKLDGPDDRPLFLPGRMPEPAALADPEASISFGAPRPIGGRASPFQARAPPLA